MRKLDFSYIHQSEDQVPTAPRVQKIFQLKVILLLHLNQSFKRNASTPFK